MDGCTLSYHICQVVVLDDISQQLTARQADARSDDIYAVSESLFGYHMCRACTH